MPRILIVDDDMFIQAVITTLLTKHGYDVTAASSGEGALQILQNQIFDLMISDVDMLPMNGLELLQKVRKGYADMGVVMLTGHDSIDVAVGAMKKGAFDFLAKPFRPDELLLTVQYSLGCCDVSSENKPSQTQPDLVEGLVAESIGMRKVCDMIKRVAPASVNVLLCGEQGADKEIVARALHHYSSRKDEPFVALDCAALSAGQMESKLFGRVNGAPADQTGLFESAHKGTLFLDNINALPLDTQPKLLDIIQNKKIYKVGGTKQIEVDVRLVVASSEKLDGLVEQGAFEENLYCRLSALCIDIPPLHNRREDIPVLVNQALRLNLGSGAETPALDPKTKEILYNYTWPGDTRELEAALRHALSLVKNGVITKEMLPEKIVSTFEEGIRAGVISREQFKGQSFKTFIQGKREELLSRVANPSDEEKKADTHDW
jgi:two-component system, NtrC family, response regulator PilR